MELIDILWRQDIDLGAGREVFDFSYRQKESELQKQRQLAEEKRLELLREREKALLSQLQLDEETGEFVPRPAAPPSEATQNVNFPEENGDAMSFDECMELLAQTFPLEATQTTASTASDAPIIMTPEQPPIQPASLQKTWPDMDQAWMELLSIPELQEMLEPRDYLNTNVSTETQDPNYSLFVPNMTDVAATTGEVCPPEFISGTPASLFSQMSLKPSDVSNNLNADGFCEIFYTDLLNTNAAAQPCEGSNEVGQLAEMQQGSPLGPLEMRDLSSADGLKNSNSDVMTEFPDSDSGLSVGASPSSSSPEKSLHEDGSFGFSDSDMDEMDNGPGSTDSGYSDLFLTSFSTDVEQPTTSAKSAAAQQADMKVKHPKTEPVEASGHPKPPFTKDKQKKRAEARLSRDEQRARTLQIPFSVDTIINLPVDDFTEMMSKHQLNEAQLALVRDIRRRGKNKVAAQNCRKRKMENIVGLEYDLDSLKEEKERLLREKAEQGTSLRQMKQQLSGLYLEVFGMLRDEEGRPYSPAEYSLQQTTDGSVFLVPRVKKTLVKSDGN
ncbi:nuclear factor erythroid 2-related factor 2a isoform X2 [Denticeps clupeoides]|nr:nuclear factor erythroid 2-related factor 2 isoform X2 [Denticeps clupeoides]